MTKEEKQAQLLKQARLLVGQELARQRWSGTTPEGRREFAREMAHRRWGSDQPRCPCGEMTAKRAKARGHKCVAPETAQKAVARGTQRTNRSAR